MSISDLPWKRWFLLATNIGLPLRLILVGASPAWLVAEIVAHGLMFYSFVAPGCGWLVPVVRRFSTDKKEVWLTIDDGPLAAHTPELASKLAERGVRGTFFLIGERLSGHADLAATLLKHGHSLANHTMTHPLAFFSCLWPRPLAGEIDRCEAVLGKVDPAKNRWFRSPFGIKNLFLPSILTARSMRLVAWSLRSRDGLFCQPEKIIHRVVRQAKAGDIILMHERGPENITAILGVVDELQLRGFSFVIPTDAQLIQG